MAGDQRSNHVAFDQRTARKTEGAAVRVENTWLPLLCISSSILSVAPLTQLLLNDQERAKLSQAPIWRRRTKPTNPATPSSTHVLGSGTGTKSNSVPLGLKRKAKPAGAVPVKVPVSEAYVAST